MFLYHLANIYYKQNREYEGHMVIKKEIYPLTKRIYGSNSKEALEIQEAIIDSDLRVWQLEKILVVLKK